MVFFLTSKDCNIFIAMEFRKKRDTAHKPDLQYQTSRASVIWWVYWSCSVMLYGNMAWNRQIIKHPQENYTTCW